MDINVLDNIRRLRNEAMSSPEGNSAKIQLTVAQLDGLLKALSDQEREVMDLEKEALRAKKVVERISDYTSCVDFDTTTPADEDDGELFEIFVGESKSDLFRTFAHWDKELRSFYVDDAEGNPEIDERVVHFWRIALPEPHEAIDFEELIED